MEKQKELCYNGANGAREKQPEHGISFALSLSLEEKRELLKLLRERRSNGLVHEKGNS